MKPLVSIIIPAYNEQRRIARAITSAQEQTCDSIEIIVVDDASDDHTRNIVLAMASADSRLSMVTHDTNMGLSRSRIDGTKKALGEYILFLDADDTLEPDAVAAMLQQAELTGCDIILSGARRVTRRLHINAPFFVPNRVFDKKIYYTRELLPLLLSKQGLSVSACGRLYRRSLLTDNFTVADTKFMGEDMILNLSLFNTGARLSWIDDITYNWTMGGASSMSSRVLWQQNVDLYHRCRARLEASGSLTDILLNALNEGLKAELVSTVAGMLANPLRRRRMIARWVNEQLSSTHFTTETCDSIMCQSRQHLSRYRLFHLAMPVLNIL